MIKNAWIAVCMLSASLLSAQKSYQPSPENMKARTEFQDEKFGLFIHYGLYSQLGRGEWVMNNDNIPVADYAKLKDFFYPINFNAQEYVSLVKKAGMKYITLVTRHHDSFSLWDTKQSDFNSVNSPLGRDLVRELADEAHKQGIKIAFYYSILDWRRDDYAYWTGRTGKGTGRTTKRDWEDYIRFMKAQLTELLTQYGEVSAIWLDGYWDQMEEEKENRDEKTFVDWHMDEIYDLIHQLQPQCLIGNNHHLSPLSGEDFQMFERDLPGQNTHGLSFQEVSALPLESAVTLNDSWGYNLKDDHTKSFAEFVRLLVGAAGSNANLLMNVGPDPTGAIPPQFVERLLQIGDWMKTYGESIYKTRGGYLKPQEWGVLTQNEKQIFVHILKPDVQKLVLEDFPFQKIKAATLLKNGQKVKFSLNKKVLTLFAPEEVTEEEPDQVIVLNIK